MINKCWCTKWCCYDDPYDKQCMKIVTKNNMKVRCKRYGIMYHKETKRYYCEMHYMIFVAELNNKKDTDIIHSSDDNMDSSYECYSNSD